MRADALAIDDAQADSMMDIVDYGLDILPCDILCSFSLMFFSVDLEEIEEPRAVADIAKALSGKIRY